MNDVNSIDSAMVGDRYMVSVVGWMVLENITMAEGGLERKEQMAISE